MADVTVKRFEELDSYQGQGVPKGQFAYAGKGLGVTAWGMNLLKLPAAWAGYPDHNHEKDGQEEVYIVLEGTATLEADGQSWALERGTLARVGPNQKRKIVPGPKGATILAIGGTPGKPYTPRG